MPDIFKWLLTHDVIKHTQVVVCIYAWVLMMPELAVQSFHHKTLCALNESWGKTSPSPEIGVAEHVGTKLEFHADKSHHVNFRTYARE